MKCESVSLIFRVTIAHTSNQVLGIAGWRFAFFFVASLALALAAIVMTFCSDPARGSMDQSFDQIGVTAPADDAGASVVEDERASLLAQQSKNPEERVAPVTRRKGSENSKSFQQWCWEVVAFFKLRTFTFMVIQGLLGCIPWVRHSMCTSHLTLKLLVFNGQFLLLGWEFI
jgi:hypothetical protein